MIGAAVSTISRPSMAAPIGIEATSKLEVPAYWIEAYWISILWSLPLAYSKCALHAIPVAGMTGRFHLPLQEAAFAAYAERDFGTTAKLLSELLQQDSSPRWLEMRAQAGGMVDAAPM